MFRVVSGASARRAAALENEMARLPSPMWRLLLLPCTFASLGCRRTWSTVSAGSIACLSSTAHYVDVCISVS